MSSRDNVKLLLSVNFHMSYLFLTASGFLCLTYPSRFRRFAFSLGFSLISLLAPTDLQEQCTGVASSSIDRGCCETHMAKFISWIVVIIDVIRERVSLCGVVRTQDASIHRWRVLYSYRFLRDVPRQARVD